MTNLAWVTNAPAAPTLSQIRAAHTSLDGMSDAQCSEAYWAWREQFTLGPPHATAFKSVAQLRDEMGLIGLYRPQEPATFTQEPSNGNP